MPPHSRYRGRPVALLTQHGKERVIAPVLEPGLGCQVTLVSGYDTDQLGTFTRDTPRPGTQLDAVRRKARKGMELSGAMLGLASEGSFGPDPFTGMLPWNVEMLAWIDDDLGIEVIGVAQGPARSAHALCKHWLEVESFARREDFPAHQLVLRADGPDGPGIQKGIANWGALKAAFEHSLAHSQRGQVFIEHDLRAFANPRRMQCIEQAAQDLLKRLQSHCPACEAPGFWLTERHPGLPCAACGLPTSSILSEAWTCVRCEHRHVMPRADRTEADPTHCGYCNP